MSSVRFVQRLSAPATGWTVSADVIVVGSGIAGLTAALELRRQVGKVLIVTKGPLSSGNTVWAQGGIAAALDPEDTAEEHLADTLVAGAGLCSEQAVRALVTEGPERVRKLVERGAHFDTQADGSITLTREGGHHRDRIAHAGGDATGAEISRALVARLEAVRADPSIEVIETAMVVDLLTALRESLARAGGAEEAPAKKVPARKSAAKKAPAKKAPAKKTAAKKPAAKKTPVKKAAAKKAPAKRTRKTA